jgi:hypothetical protein
MGRVRINGDQSHVSLLPRKLGQKLRRYEPLWSQKWHLCRLFMDKHEQVCGPRGLAIKHRWSRTGGYKSEMASSTCRTFWQASPMNISCTSEPGGGPQCRPGSGITRRLKNQGMVGGEGGFEPTVRLPVQRFSSSKILMLACAAQ